MAWNTTTYHLARKKMQPGDIIAFGGKGNFSEIIKWATRSTVSHVGIILHAKLYYEDTSQDGYFNQLIESTSLNDFAGVTISRLSDRIDTYDGKIWWLPLSQASRDQMVFKKFYDFLLHQNRKPYDMPQAVKSALDFFDETPLVGRTTHNIEDFSRFFCSELAAAGLEAGGVIGSLNASEVTPIDLCRFKIYRAAYYQLKGRGNEIRGYNSLDPQGWGE